MMVLDKIKLYGAYAGTAVKSQMQYRSSFFMLLLGHFLVTIIEFAGIYALFDRFGSLRGWTLTEVALLYGMANMAFSLAEVFGDGFHHFSKMIKAGEFDRILLRPRASAFQLLGYDLKLDRLGRFAQGIVLLTWAVIQLDLALSPGKLLFISATILSGGCLFFGLFMLQATLCFWTVESLEIVHVLTYGGVEAAQYPISIYRAWFQAFFTYIVPLACLNYFPTLAVLGKSSVSGIPTLLLWTSPLVGILFLAVVVQIWIFGVRHYCSTGS
jgi:ABC-2 type transport system permease protein